MSKINIFFTAFFFILFCFQSYAQNDSIAKNIEELQIDTLKTDIQQFSLNAVNDSLAIIDSKLIYNPQRDSKRKQICLSSN